MWHTRDRRLAAHGDRFTQSGGSAGDWFSPRARLVVA
jgi:hypothetical protein